MKNFAVALCAAFSLAACDQVRAVGAASPAAAAQAHSFEYRVASIDRDVQEYRTLGTKTVVINGTIEFMQSADAPVGNYMLIGKLRIQGAGETNERDLFVLIERGRGEYEGILYSNYDMPRADPTPEISPGQIGVTITGVVPLNEAELTRLADSVQQTNAAQAPAQPAN
jgi:hypothetical protein